MEPLAPRHRYPFDLVDVWHARDGSRVLIRPVHPQDLELAREFVRELSPESRYNRFHQPLNELTPQMARWATHVDYERHMALIAVVYRDGRELEIGAARYVVREDDAETAEFAIAVADRWHRQGVAERLLRGLIAVAARRGLRWLEGDVLASNRGMRELARKLGFQSRKRHPDARLVTLSRRVTAQDADAAGRAPVRGGWLGLLRSFAPMGARAV
jgi:acetyltransferase